ncbi:MAG: hypothetical protein ACR652_18490 [Methylocystis sp.]|uniref:hypothetical protein n=1 Tax=Methylocystis sp. TaxID=1911079 RepID=UPI003DA68730
MTRVFTVDENNDLVIASDGRLSISVELEAVLQACEHAAKAQLTEMVLAVDEGVPNFQTIWSGSPNVLQFEGYLRRQLLRVVGVLDIASLSVTVSNNVLSYTAVIVTEFGQGALNG